MNERSRSELIHGYLDGMLDPDALQELSCWIRSSPQNAREFADVVLFHDRVQLEIQAAEILQEQPQPAGASRNRTGRRLGTSVFVSTLACLVLVVAVMVWQSLESPVLAGDAELLRLIRSSENMPDRTYVVSVIEASTNSLPTSDGKNTAQPSVDGAVLHLRGSNQYVLIRMFADGSRFVTGSDGKSAWSVPPNGRIHVSSDISRFRGSLPGQQHAIPFIDLRSSLQQLRESYDFVISPDPRRSGYRRLTATRKDTAFGGPKQVTIWYDPNSGRIDTMLMERLPQRRSGPRSVLLELTEERDLGADFFEHSSHHSSNREVIQE